MCADDRTHELLPRAASPGDVETSKKANGAEASPSAPFALVSEIG